MIRISIPTFALALCAACTDKAGDDTAGPTDSTDSAPPATVALRLNVTDIMTGDVLVGAAVDAEGQTQTSDSEGNVTFEVPVNAPLAVRGSADGYMDSTLHLLSLEEDFSSYIPMLETRVRDGLSAQLGVPYDPAKAMLMLRVYRRDAAGALTELGGVTVDLDASYDVVLSTVLDAPGGLVPSNVTDGNPIAQLTFVNVTAGEVGFSLTTPEDVEYCTWYRGDTRVEDWSPTLEADRVNGVFIVCY